MTIGPLSSSGLPSGSTTRPIDGITDRDAQQLARCADLVTLGDFEILAEYDDAYGVFFEVERQAADAGARELDHLAGHDARQAVDAGDAVAHLEHPAHFASFELGPVLVNFRSQNRNDLVGFESHGYFFR